MAQEDPYEVLGVPHGADAKTIKLAFRRLSLKHHPDKNPPERRAEAETAFKRLAWAYGVLGDEERRAEFDRTGATGDANEDPAAAFNIDKRFAGADFDLFFNMGDVGGISASSPPGGGNAGGLAAPQAERGIPTAATMGDALSPDSAERAADMVRAQAQAQVQVRVGLRALFKGGQDVVQVNQWVACPACGGSGRVAMRGKPVCTTCYGGDPDCAICGGSIEAFMMHTIGTSTQQCTDCAGRGLTKCRLKQTVQIPPGCPDGMVAEVAARQGPPVRVHYVVALPTQFARRGSELCMTLPISVGEALSGFRRALRLPGGTQLQLSIPGVVRPGCHWRVPGAGLPEFGGSTADTGDMVLNFVVQWPETAWTRSDYAKAGKALARGGSPEEPQGVAPLTATQAGRWAHVIRCSAA